MVSQLRREVPYTLLPKFRRQGCANIKWKKLDATGSDAMFGDDNINFD
jgi:hypothetical protein